MISAVLPHARLLFVQRVITLPNQQGTSWSHRWSWFPATYLVCQVGGTLARTKRRAQRVDFIIIVILDNAIDHGA